jgi:hypothetical protein
MIMARSQLGTQALPRFYLAADAVLIATVIHVRNYFD